MKPLEGRIALITGAKGGLGTFVTQAVLEAGAKVIGVSRSIKQGDFEHPNFVAHAAEMGDPGAAKTVADEIAGEHGRLDIAMHLVGGFVMAGAVEDTGDAVFDKMLDINFRSALHVFRAVLPHMRRQGWGRILAVGSRAAVDPVRHAGAYNVSKAALVSLVRTIAEENKGTGISANIVLPGTMDTPGNRAAMPDADASKWVKPAQVASLLAYLASDEASQVTGAAIPIYGPTL
ncbi:MAG: SDR family NAD(P)-dependent oxidoreductase [Bryobacterales bacterium]|nr:SDR family NAD(P)-dependent oxidoreductase [Bryobacterales bacterium]